MARTVVWRREDAEGVGLARVEELPDGITVCGYEVTVRGAARFEVHLDADWRTRTVVLESLAHDGQQRLVLEADGRGTWRVDGAPAPQLEGCIDIDLFCVPVTNTFPIRRSRLSEGEEADIRAVWVGIPELEVEVLDQTYRRVGAHPNGEDTYQYRARGSHSSSWMTVDEDGLVIDYEDFAKRLPHP